MFAWNLEVIFTCTFIIISCIYVLQPGGVSMQSTQFSRGSKEGRGDTSIWTDTPTDRAQKAKMKYVSSHI